MANKLKSKEKIILATIECIERKGFHQVTVRDIAEQAEVNIAVVNYHFGTKEKLMDDALEFTLYNSLAGDVDEIEKTCTDPYSMLKAFCIFFFEGAQRFPNISRAHIYEPLANNDYHGIFVKWLNQFSGRLAKRIEKLGGTNLDSNNLKYSISQLITSILFWSLMPDLFKNFLKVDFRDPVKRDEYIDRLLAGFRDITGGKQ